MDVKKSRELYIEKVIKSIPHHIKPVDYLMEALNISRVSVYRRLKCVLPFTYDEMIILATRLGFSIDDILHTNLDEEKAIFSFQQYEESSLQGIFLTILTNIYENVKEQEKAGNRTSIISINNLWLIYLFGYDHLLKFFYYKWLHQISFNSYRLIYPEIELSAEIVEMSNKIEDKLQLLSNSIFIIDKNIFFHTMEEIQYYYRRNIIGDDELAAIRNDLEKLIEYTQSHVLFGKNKKGKARSFYLSSMNVYSNSIYVECDGVGQSFFYEYNPSPFNTTNVHICAFHKRWLESLKKYSILMTASNEVLQIDFFKKQRRYLNDLMENTDLVP